MRDTDLYARILGVQDPWSITDVRLDMPGEQVEITLAHRPDTPLRCPECGAEGPGYDTRPRRWRHLDTCQYQTIVIATVPRVRCAVHGVRQVAVPWAEPGSHFTALFEALAIDWLKAASLTAVADLLGLSWDEVEGIQARAVRRGLARRAPQLPVQCQRSSNSPHPWSTKSPHPPVTW